MKRSAFLPAVQESESMAKAKLNGALTELSGRVGNLVFQRHLGTTVVAERLRELRKWTGAQTDFQQRFREATAYARAVLADPLQRELYRAIAAERRKPVNATLITNYLTPPETVRIEAAGYTGAPGQRIKVLVIDDIEVVDVRLAITTPTAGLLEEGSAEKIHGVWVYRTFQTAPAERPLLIKAVAIDRPSHRGELIVERS